MERRIFTSRLMPGARVVLLLASMLACALPAAAGAALKPAVKVAAGTSIATGGGSVPGIVDIDTSLGYQQGAAAGTGIVLTSTGEILTNNHVIRGETNVKVTDIDNGHTYAAKVVGYDLAADVAVVQLKNASNLQTARIGSSTGAKVGDTVTAYGNAGGVGGTPSTAGGKIVGLGRSITASDDSGDSEKLTGLIETNAALEPGDSGGPIVDSSGTVIGMDTAASSSFQLEFQSSAPRGYAIPIQKATAIAAQIVAGHSSATIHVGATGFMGVSVEPQRSFFGDQSGGGLMVSGVVPGSPVEKAGLEPGDVVTAFDGKVIDTPSKLTALVITKAPGDTVRIHWIDAFGTAHSSTLRLVSGPPQ